MNKEELLLHGDIKKTYISYLIPTITGMITNSIFCICDVMFIGLYIGAKGLASFQCRYADLYHLFLFGLDARCRRSCNHFRHDWS